MAQLNNREYCADRAIVSRRLAETARDEAIGQIRLDFAKRYEALAGREETGRPRLYCVTA